LKKTSIELFVIEKVKEKRISLGISQSELAIRMNLSNGFIGKIESYKFNAKYNLNHLNMLSEIFSCSPKDFLPDNKLD
jgi:transcriptional regulator with XRE-family HTH domain